MSQPIKYAFVMPGGGFKGSFQVGALDALLGAGITPSFVSGVSVGALNGALLAQDKFKELKLLWSEVHDHGYGEIWKSWIVKEQAGKLKVKLGGAAEVLLTGSILTRKALGDTDPLRDKLERYVRKDHFRVPFKLGAYSLTTGYRSIGPEDCPDDRTLAHAIQASATMPLIWNPVESLSLKDETLTQVVDGGLHSVAPLKEAIDYIASQPDWESWVMVVIPCTAGELAPAAEDLRLLGIAGRTLDVFLNNVYQADLGRFELINRLVQASGQSRLSGYRYLPSLVIKPGPEGLGSTLDSRPQTLRHRFNLGYRLAKEALQTQSVL